MSTEDDAFAASLERVDVAVTRTSTDDAPSAIRDAVTPPAVAVDRDVIDLSLVDADVTVDPTPEQLRTAQTGITPGEIGITEYGSAVLRCTGDGAEFLALYPERHVVVLVASDVVEDMPTAIDTLADPVRDEAADFIIATGPSATADMGSVVQGVHGPNEVHAIILEDR